jgi:hypothetical protein
MESTVKNTVSDGGLLKNTLFVIGVIAAFSFGLYSLILAYANAGKVKPVIASGLQRTAAAGDTDKIETALGQATDQDLVFLILDTLDVGSDPGVRTAVQSATRALADSGLTCSLRYMHPETFDFWKIVEQNGVVYFPAVLAVKRKGGIILLADDLDKNRLLAAYYEVWGKTSTCNDAKSFVY